MEILITICAIIWIVIIIIACLGQLHDSNLRVNETINRSITQEWKTFAEYVETKHEAFIFDEVTTKWILDNKDKEWNEIKHQIPDEIRNHFNIFTSKIHLYL